MVVVDMPKYGGPRWYVQEFVSGIHKPWPMVIPNCGRCVGVFIFCRSVNHSGAMKVIAMHISPIGCGQDSRMVPKEVFRKLRKDMEGYVPYMLICGGGNIDTPKHKAHYNLLLRKFIKPFLYLFPAIEASAYHPTNDTALTTIYMDKDLNVGIRRLYYKATA